MDLTKPLGFIHFNLLLTPLASSSLLDFFDLFLFLSIYSLEIRINHVKKLNGREILISHVNFIHK